MLSRPALVDAVHAGVEIDGICPVIIRHDHPADLADREGYHPHKVICTFNQCSYSYPPPLNALANAAICSTCSFVIPLDASRSARVSGRSLKSCK